MSIFDDNEAKRVAKFNEAMANLTEKEKEMYAQYPDFFKRAKKACLTMGKAPMRVRKSGTSAHGTYVTGPVVSAKPAYYRVLARSIEIVFEAQIETTHPATGAKHLHTVFIKRLPK